LILRYAPFVPPGKQDDRGTPLGRQDGGVTQPLRWVVRSWVMSLEWRMAEEAAGEWARGEPVGRGGWFGEGFGGDRRRCGRCGF